jgi:murein DD-endopeptidase MepM/ murein hydrolase activator NlpD
MKFQLTSAFGVMERVRDGKAHTGIDLAMPVGTELRSIADGVVERVTDYVGNIGNGVIIRLEDGTRLIYGHMSDIDVKVGQKIDAGELIGLSGNSGHSTGPHLHFGMMKDGEYVDPTPIAEHLANMSGDVTHVGGWSLFQANGVLTDLIRNNITQPAKEKMKEEMTEAVITFFEVLRDVVIELTYSITLVGGGILILLRVAGLQNGGRWASVLFLANILIKFLLGGYVA